jgi:hypothetical protein
MGNRATATFPVTPLQFLVRGEQAEHGGDDGIDGGAQRGSERRGGSTAGDLGFQFFRETESEREREIEHGREGFHGHPYPLLPSGAAAQIMAQASGRRGDTLHCQSERKMTKVIF